MCHSLASWRYPRSECAVGRTWEREVDMRINVQGSRRYRLNEKMTVRAMDVKTVTPHVSFSDESWPETRTPMTAEVEGCPVIGENIPTENWRGLGKDDVRHWDEFSQVCQYFVL